MPLTFPSVADALAGAPGLFISMLLIGLLALRELVYAAGGPHLKLWARLLHVAIVPLLVVFGLSITLRLAEDSGVQLPQVHVPAEALAALDTNTLEAGQAIHIAAARPAQERQP
jgi:hypothetical protein